jgi:hypothetical protein
MEKIQTDRNSEANSSSLAIILQTRLQMMQEQIIHCSYKFDDANVLLLLLLLLNITQNL